MGTEYIESLLNSRSEEEEPPQPGRLRSLEEGVAALERAEDQWQVVEAIHWYCAPAFAVCAVFIGHGDIFEALPPVGHDRPSVPIFRPLRLPREAPGMLRRAFENREWYSGPSGTGEADTRLMGWMGVAPGERAFVAPLIYDGHSELLLVGAQPRQGFGPEEVQRILTFLEKAALAAQIVILRRRLHTVAA